MSKKPDHGGRILIVNVHSQANAGDHAILLGQLQLLEKMSPAAIVTITSRTPELDRPSLAARGVRVIAPIFHVPRGISGKWRSRGKAFLSLAFPVQALAFLRRLRRTDLVLACGGGYFYSNQKIPGLTFWQNYLHVRLAIAFRKPVVFFPQSYGPLANPLSRRLLSGLLAADQVRVVFAREAISLALLHDLRLPAGAKEKFRFCPDMAIYFSAAAGRPDPVAPMPRPCLALALRDWSFPDQKTGAAKKRARENYLQGIIGTCLALHAQCNASFVIFSQAQGPGAEEDDRRMTRVVLDRLRARVAPTHLRHVRTPIASSPSMILHLLQHADLLLTSRLHAAILAFLVGTPAAVIEYQHKSLGVLRAMGLEACSLPIAETGQETLFPLCANILQNRGDWQKKIRRAVSESRVAIEEKFSGVI